MRQTISGLVAAIAVATGSAAPAMACGGELFYVGPCAQAYVPTYGYSSCYSGCWAGCYSGCWAYERLPDPTLQYHLSYRLPQYYYVNQGPTYTGPGNFAPYPTYQEGAVSGRDAYHRHLHYRHPHIPRRYY
jgi:hypothetical protein